MPVVSDPPRESGAPDLLGPFSAILLSDGGGLTQFGAFTETLPPGSASSRHHWHAAEDEFIYVLSGCVTLLEGTAVTEMGPGDAATFKAGAAVGHHLENRSATPVTYLVVGTRSRRDVVHFPLTGETLEIDRDTGQRLRRDAAGQVIAS